MAVDPKIRLILAAIPASMEGASVEPKFAQVAERAGVPVSTAYRLRKGSEEIEKAWAEALSGFRSVEPSGSEGETIGALRAVIRTMAVHIEVLRRELEKRDALIARLAPQSRQVQGLAPPQVDASNSQFL